MKKEAVLLVSLLICCILVESTTIYVSKGPTGSGNGTEGNPYGSITEALNEVTDNSIEILLKDGVYDNTLNTFIRVDSRNVTISAVEDASVLFSCTNSENPVFQLAGTGGLNLYLLKFTGCKKIISYELNYHQGQASFPVSIESCQFNENNGDLIVLQNTNSLSIKNSNFDSNPGGHILRYNGKSSSLFIENSSFTNSKSGLYLTDVSISIQNAKFNQFQERIIFLNPLKRASDQIINCTFSNSYTKYSGGAIYSFFTMGNSYGSLKILDSKFTNNGAKYQGGAVWVGANSYPYGTSNNIYTVTINNTNFADFYAAKGSALYLAAPFVSVSFANFTTSNTNETEEIYLANQNEVSFTNTTFSKTKNLLACQDKCDCNTDNSVLAKNQKCECTYTGSSTGIHFGTVAKIILYSFGSALVCSCILICIVAVVIYKKLIQVEYIVGNLNEEDGDEHSIGAHQTDVINDDNL